MTVALKAFEGPLSATAIGTAVLALVPGFSMRWKANYVVDVLLLGYVGLLVSARPAALEVRVDALSQLDLERRVFAAEGRSRIHPWSTGERPVLTRTRGSR